MDFRTPNFIDNNNVNHNSHSPETIKNNIKFDGLERQFLWQRL